MKQEVELGGLAIAGPFLFAALATFRSLTDPNGDRHPGDTKLLLQTVQNQSDAARTNDIPATPVK
jgi:hypothetical protein